jgi:hypothetical protein
LPNDRVALFGRVTMLEEAGVFLGSMLALLLSGVLESLFCTKHDSCKRCAASFFMVHS